MKSALEIAKEWLAYNHNRTELDGDSVDILAEAVVGLTEIENYLGGLAAEQRNKIEHQSQALKEASFILRKMGKGIPIIEEWLSKYGTK